MRIAQVIRRPVDDLADLGDLAVPVELDARNDTATPSRLQPLTEQHAAGGAGDDERVGEEISAAQRLQQPATLDPAAVGPDFARRDSDRPALIYECTVPEAA